MHPGKWLFILWTRYSISFRLRKTDKNHFFCREITRSFVGVIGLAWMSTLLKWVCFQHKQCQFNLQTLGSCCDYIGWIGIHVLCSKPFLTNLYKLYIKHFILLIDASRMALRPCLQYMKKVYLCGQSRKNS